MWRAGGEEREGEARYSRCGGWTDDSSVIADCSDDVGKSQEENEHEGEGESNLHLGKGECPAALHCAHNPPPNADGGGEAIAVVARYALPHRPRALGGEDEACGRREKTGSGLICERISNATHPI